MLMITRRKTLLYLNARGLIDFPPAQHACSPETQQLQVKNTSTYPKMFTSDKL